MQKVSRAGTLLRLGTSYYSIPMTTPRAYHHMHTHASRKLAIISCTSLFAFLLLRTAWISDDAAITLRTTLNFLHGYGPVFNIDERVQAYTHPLWFLLLSLSSLITRNIYIATYGLSIVTSCAALALLLAQSRQTWWNLMLAGLPLLFSKAFLDFSTSGLENPLSHLLVAACVLSINSHGEERPLEPRNLTAFFLLAGQLYLTRPDLLLLIAPLAMRIAFAARCNMRHTVYALLIAGIPVLLWTLFSLYYYGSPVPNTAYAKLGTGIPLAEKFQQGVIYFIHSIGQDPITPALIVIGLWLGLRSDWTNRALSLGIILYLLYTASIGGDFMAGRFLTAPMFAAAIMVARTPIPPALTLPLAASLSVLALTTLPHTLLSSYDYHDRYVGPSGIANERGFYYEEHGLLNMSRTRLKQPEWTTPSRMSKIGNVDTICGGLGFASINSGPSVHWIDICALADPLLSHIAPPPNAKWRIGHFKRAIPDGYKASLQQDRNMLASPMLKAYYDTVRLITRAPLNAPGRIQAIIDSNLGRRPTLPRGTTAPGQPSTNAADSH